MESVTVTDQQLRLLCLLNLAEEGKQLLLGQLAVNKKMKVSRNNTFTTSNDPSVALAQILTYTKKPVLEELRKDVCMRNFIVTIFRPIKNGYEVKTSIDISRFDLAALYYLLTMNISVFPTRKSRYRKEDGGLKCMQPNHCTKCCLQCNHLAKSACSSCKESHYNCYNDHTPCCTNCYSCAACAIQVNGQVCTYMDIRKAIEFLHNVRNLNAHANNATYENLIAGKFFNTAFPTCNNWNTLWNESADHLLKIFSYLYQKNVIDQSKFYTTREEIVTKLPAMTEIELSRLYPQVILAHCKDLERLNFELADALKSRPLIFKLQFKLVEKSDKSLWNSVYRFVGWDDPTTLSQDEFKPLTPLSLALEKHVDIFAERPGSAS